MGKVSAQAPLTLPRYEMVVRVQLTDGDSPRDLRAHRAVIGEERQHALRLVLRLGIHVGNDVNPRLAHRGSACARDQTERHQRCDRDHDQRVDEPCRQLVRSDAILEDLVEQNGLGLFEQLPRVALVELRVDSLDHQEEAIIRHTGEALLQVERMVVARQPVQDQHREQRGDRAEQDGQLEGDRDVRGNAEEGLAADQPLVVVGVGPPLQKQTAAAARQASDQHNPGKDRRLDAHGGVDPVHREGRVGVPLLESGVAHAFGGLDQCGGGFVFRQEPVQRGFRGGFSGFLLRVAHGFTRGRGLSSVPRACGHAPRGERPSPLPSPRLADTCRTAGTA